MAVINPNNYIKQLRDFEDKLADGITRFAGNIRFVYFHVLWFTLWILAGTGFFGPSWQFDTFPFGLLTTTVSLEAIFLATFVLISQNRSSAKSEIRAQLDYETDVQSEREIMVVMQMLARIAEKTGVDVTDLKSEMDEVKTQAEREAERRAVMHHHHKRRRFSRMMKG